MPRYAFTFKKDDIFVEFVTSDKDVVERQFQIWVADADDYASSLLKKNLKQATPKQEPKSEPVAVQSLDSNQPIEEEQSAEVVVDEPVAETPVEITESVSLEPEIAPEEIVQEVAPAPVVETPSEPKVEPQAEPNFVEFKIEKEEPVSVEAEVGQAESTQEVFDNASNLLRTINTIQTPPTVEEKSVETVKFEDVLEKSIENPTFEPAVGNKDQIFLNLVKSKNTSDKFHYLMITAYYLSEFEKRERFTLKQINSKLMQNLAMAIDHTTLQEAINQNFVELVPDLTGTSEVAEYRLTNSGEEFFAKI